MATIDPKDYPSFIFTGNNRPPDALKTEPIPGLAYALWKIKELTR